MIRSIHRSSWLWLLFVLFPSSSASAKVLERVVAVVNSEVILLSELNERLAPALPQLEQIADREARKKKLVELQKEALNQMIDDLLIDQEARNLKITVTDKDLELAIADVMKRNNLTLAQLEEALKNEGKSLTAYKYSMLKPQLTRLRVLNIQVRSRINVSDEEVQSYYQSNMRALGVEAKLSCRQIFFNVPASSSQPEQNARRLQLEELRKKIEAGEDFAEVAKQYSEDPETKEKGGEMEKFSRGSLPTRIEDVLFALKQGQLSPVLRSKKGLHLYKIEEREEASARSFEEVKEELMQQIYQTKLEKATKSWVEEVRKRSFIENRL